MSYLGDNIKKIRTMKKMTISELAKKSNSSVSSISQIENGKRDATFKMMLGIAQALEIDITELVTSSEKIIYKHNLNFVLHIENNSILFGTSTSSANEVNGWGIVICRKEWILKEVLYFESNNKSVVSNDFLKNILLPFLLHQRLRILLRADLRLSISSEDIIQTTQRWEDIKSVMIKFQQVIFNLICSSQNKILED